MAIFRPRCPKCHLAFSDWFVWTNGLMHCFPCWMKSGYTKTVLEDGTTAYELWVKAWERVL